ncbi:unnamed protein product [Closterium sp. Yama58-4]|nr:unnamed protein product [Closterium sp. Yama58-4]
MALASLACASPTIAASSLAFAAARATSLRRHYAYAALALRLPLMRPPFPALPADPSALCVLLEEEMRPPHERMQHAREQRDLAEAALETRQRWDRRREARGRRAEKQGRAEAAMDAMDAEEAAIAAAMAKVKPGDASGLIPAEEELAMFKEWAARQATLPTPSSLAVPRPSRPRRAPATSPSLIPAEEELAMFKEWAARKLRGAPRGAEGVAVARGLAHMRRTLEGAVREEQDARRRGDAGGSGGSGEIGEIGGSGGRAGAEGRGDGGDRGGGVRGRKGSEGRRVEQTWEKDQREWGTMWAKGSGGRGEGEGGRRGLGDGVAEVVADLEERRRRVGGGEGEGRKGVRGEGNGGRKKGRRGGDGGERGERWI